MKKDLDVIKRYQRELTLLNQTNSLLDWDQQTYMPRDGVASRADQKALISSLTHARITSDELFGSVKRLKRIHLSGSNKIMVDKLFTQILRHRKLPKEFVEELSKRTSLAFSAWENAKTQNHFDVFAPHLEKIVQLKRKQAQYINLSGHPYNGLMDEFEEGMTVEKIKPAFDELKKQLLALLAMIEKSGCYKSQKLKSPGHSVQRDVQMQMCRDVIERIGLDKEKSRIDFSAHPFTTTIGIHDVRITTNIRPNSWFAFESTIHEAGHALYELNMPEKFAYTVLREAPSYGLHESQSRFWENMIGKSKPFWKYYSRKYNGKDKLNLDFDQLYREINRITPGLIRVESDEIHYCLHIILRFELETGLIEGSVKVKDLPDIWNRKMKEMIGVVPKNNTEGVLQDVHWSCGLFGYFPSYALGSIYAAQIYDTIKRDIPDMEKNISRGDFGIVRKWLLEHIHGYGATYSADDLIRKICGERLNPRVYINYLTRKYREIYTF